jgi:hypothetical protein
VTFRLEGEVSGEVGLLAPDQAQLRGITVCTTMRPLATVSDDDSGWPIAAVVNDDRITPSPAFDGVAKRDDIQRLWVAIREGAKPSLEKLLAAPANALGVVRLPFPLRTSNVSVLGVFWLEPEWPENPTIDVILPGARLVRSPAPAGQVLPIHGRLFAFCTIYELEHALEEVLGQVRKQIGPIVTRSKNAPAEYLWDLRRLGVLTDHPIDKELAGDEPDAALLRVVEKRAPHLIVPERPETIVTAADAPIDAPASESFFRGITRKLTGIVTPSPAPPVGGDLERAIGAMKLTGDPVTAIVSVRSGRPVRYDSGARKLLVNTRHPAVVALDDHPARTFHLLTAAVSEINRELEAVTDSEELAILRDLLQQ